MIQSFPQISIVHEIGVININESIHLRNHSTKRWDVTLKTPWTWQWVHFPHPHPSLHQCTDTSQLGRWCLIEKTCLLWKIEVFGLEFKVGFVFSGMTKPQKRRFNTANLRWNLSIWDILRPAHLDHSAHPTGWDQKFPTSFVLPSLWVFKGLQQNLHFDVHPSSRNQQVSSKQNTSLSAGHSSSQSIFTRVAWPTWPAKFCSFGDLWWLDDYTYLLMD